MKRFFVLVLALGFLFAGCAKRAITVQPEQPVAAKEEVQKATTSEAPKAKEEKKIEVKKVEPAPVTKEEAKKVETISVKEAVETKESQAKFENIHFDFDKYDIRDDAKPVLKVVSDWLIKNRKNKMLLEGHCDEVGTNEYNLALGERRAKSARDYLVTLGVAKDRFEMISYGEEKPLCKEQTNECWQKNRRVQFVIK
ncbi:MAG: peptidoglycan-associated lipoprotein Pal [Nitrospirae bacterium]|nr:peptidoglycan-associated lipoprotein Pal [Nitrospirota bacterium]